MTDHTDIDTDAAALAQLMREKLRVRGRTLRSVLARGRYRLPKRIVRAVTQLADAQTLAENPRLRPTLDTEALSRARHEVELYLADIDPADERRGRLLGILASLAINLLTLIVLLIAVLLWRGFL